MTLKVIAVFATMRTELLLYPEQHRGQITCVVGDMPTTLLVSLTSNGTKVSIYVVWSVANRI